MTCMAHKKRGWNLVGLQPFNMKQIYELCLKINLFFLDFQMTPLPKSQQICKIRPQNTVNQFFIELNFTDKKMGRCSESLGLLM